MRTHLYGSLLYYLQIAQRPDEPDTLEAGRIRFLSFLFLEIGYFKLKKKKSPFHLLAQQSYNK